MSQTTTTYTRKRGIVIYDELIQKLSEERQRVWNEYRSDLTSFDVATATAETRAKYDRMDADLAEIDKRIKTIRDQAGIEQTAAEARENHERVIREVGIDKVESADDKLVAALRTKGAGMDISLRGIAGPAEGFEQRVLSSTAAAGGVTIPPRFSPLLYKYLIQNSAIRQTNVRVITTSNGEPFVQPKFSSYPSDATIVGEGAGIAASDPTFAAATLSAYKFGTIWQVSNELLQDSAYDILNELSFVFGRALANGEGKKFVLGTGTSEPQGFLVAAGTVYRVTGGTPAASGPTYANLVDTMHKVIPQYRLNATWMLNDNTLALLRKLVDTSNRPLWQPGLNGFGTDVPDTILGKPYVIDPYMPDSAVGATSIAFGDFSGYLIRELPDVRLERSDDYAFGSDLVTFRILHRCDGALIDDKGAIATYKGGTA